MHCRLRRFFLCIVAGLTVVFLLFGFEFSLPVSAQTSSIRFENISTEQGLSQSTVNAIIQDRQGFLWFATEGGLNKYNGYQFTAYEHDPDNPSSLSSDVINSLFEGPDGSIWVGTNTGLDRFAPSSGRFVHYDKTLTGSDVLDGKLIQTITGDPSGLLWIGTDGGGLVSVDPVTHHIASYKNKAGDPNSLSNDSVNTVYASRDGELWIGTGGGLDQLDRQTGKFTHPFQVSTGSSVLDGVPVRAIFEDASGAVWIGSKQGLIRWDRTANRYVQYRHNPDDQRSLSDDSVKGVYRDSHEVLWIGTMRGLNQFDEADHSFLNYLHDSNDPSSLSSDYIRSILEDRSGVLWIGTSFGGLNKYARSTQKFKLYTVHPGRPDTLSDENIWSVYKDQSGDLWIGTFFSGLNKLDLQSGKVTVYQHDPTDPQSISGGEIRTLLQDRKGMLWIGMENGGLDRYNPSTSTFLRYSYRADDPASLSSDHVFSIYEDHLGRLWIGTSDAGLNLFEQASGTFIRYQNDPKDPASLSSNEVRAIYEDHAGGLWVGTFGGLNLWNKEDNRFTVYRHDPNNPWSLSNDTVTSVHEDPSGAIWVGTFGGGLNRFNRSDQTFTHFTRKNGLPDDSIYGILADPNGNLWLSTNKGISKFNPQTGAFRNYDASDGLQGNQFNPGAYFQAPDGEMFFGGTKGLNAFFPREVAENPIPPPVVITAVRKYNQLLRTDLDSDEMLELSYRDNFISFEFAALDYNSPEKNQYAYKLDGVDQDWVYVGTRHSAGYANLRGGEYTFRVKAANSDGVWNEQPATLQMHITPPFWQTWWFIGIVCLVVGGGALGGYRLRVRDVESRNRELAKRVEQRTHELAALNTISAVVNSSLDLTEILNSALKKTIEVMHMDAGFAFSVEEASPGIMDEPYIRMLAHQGVSEKHARENQIVPLRSTLVYKAAQGGRPLISYDSTHPDRKVQQYHDEEGIRMSISIPLLVKGKLVGTLAMAAREPREITAEELSLLEAIGQQVGMAVVNARMYEQAEQTAIATERSRLARELHDSVTQLLYSVGLYAEAASELLATGETETAASHLCEVRDTAQEALREMRLLIFELHRPAIAEGGLAEALQVRLDAVERRGGMHAELAVDGREQIPHLIQEELYNIAREALNNILKHAHANSICIQLRFGEMETAMEIQDDGMGFEPAEDGMNGGFGIPGMKERCQRINGTLQIISAPDEGTTILVRVPVPCPEHISSTQNKPTGEKRSNHA